MSVLSAVHVRTVNVDLCGERDLADVTKLRILKWGVVVGYPGGS